MKVLNTVREKNWTVKKLHTFTKILNILKKYMVYSFWNKMGYTYLFLNYLLHEHIQKLWNCHASYSAQK